MDPSVYTISRSDSGTTDDFSGHSGGGGGGSGGGYDDGDVSHSAGGGRGGAGGVTPANSIADPEPIQSLLTKAELERPQLAADEAVRDLPSGTGPVRSPSAGADDRRAAAMDILET